MQSENEFYKNDFRNKLDSLFLNFNPNTFNQHCDELIQQMNVYVDDADFVKQVNRDIIIDLSGHKYLCGGPHGEHATDVIDYQWYPKYFTFMSKLFLSHPKYIENNSNCCELLIRFIICYPRDHVGAEDKIYFLNKLLANKDVRKAVFMKDSQQQNKLDMNQLDKLNNPYYIGGYRDIKTGEETFNCSDELRNLLNIYYTQYQEESAQPALYYVVGSVFQFFGKALLAIGNNISPPDQSRTPGNNH